MGCPGQARTKPRRKIAIASLPKIRRTAAAANIACGAWPHAAAPSAASPATPCAKHGTQIAHHRAMICALLLATACHHARPAHGPRPETPFLRQPALEGLTNLARTETPRKSDRNKSDYGKRRRTAAAGGGAQGGRRRRG
ncbi:hypothetical protein F511_26091 [Dorcoceras hygrometricum]|uniref:Uncharacterized protein n=1 Tax=Dorcoceras hygrometricum TaxID=472368 RepID=A0A2Z7CC92_9LAMI|nr:hypothetical protein F511_26091 [Dorcoceras hygrometricum]